jgi:hypothetical protein
MEVSIALPHPRYSSSLNDIPIKISGTVLSPSLVSLKRTAKSEFKSLLLSIT